MSKIFISHASRDEQIGEQLVKTLVSIGILEIDIFYTSDPNTGVPTGEKIPSTIKMKLKEADIVIFILTKNFYKSEFCLNEMGATGILEKKCTPILLDGLDYSDMKGFIDSQYMSVKPNQNEILKLFHFLKKEFKLAINDDAAKKLFEEFIKVASNYRTEPDNINNTTEEPSPEIRNNINNITSEILDNTQNTTSLEIRTTIDNNISAINEIESFILGDKISDAEALLFKYMIYRRLDVLGDYSKLENELYFIKLWEEDNNLKNTLSINYREVLRKLQFKNFIKAYSCTSYGNTREWKLIEPLNKQLFNLRKEATNRLDEIKNKHKE